MKSQPHVLKHLQTGSHVDQPVRLTGPARHNRGLDTSAVWKDARQEPPGLTQQQPANIMSAPKNSSPANKKETAPSKGQSSQDSQQPAKDQKIDWDARRSSDAPYPEGLTPNQKRRIRKFEAMIRQGGIPAAERSKSPQSEVLARIAEERAQARRKSSTAISDETADLFRDL